MKTEWVRTSAGTYMQIIVPEWEGIYDVEPPTYDEQIAASFNYMIEVYRKTFDDFVTTFIVLLETYADYLGELHETLSVLSDPETMEAIREAEAEEDIARWENEGGA